jgi:parallel beta-helix repeat protein
MVYRELDHDEHIILESRNVKFESISFDAILTNKRIHLNDSKKNVISSQNITLTTIRNVSTEENDIQDHFLLLSLVTDAGEKHQVVLTFARQAGVERKRECNEWAKKLKSLILPSTMFITPSDVPEVYREPLTQREGATPAQGTTTSRRTAKKKIENDRTVGPGVEKSPVAPESVETSSAPSGTFCSRCGNRVPLKSTFCNHCWTPIEQPSGPGQKPLPVISETQVPPRQTKPVVPKEQETAQAPTPQPLESESQFLDRSPFTGGGILNKRVMIFFILILSITAIILLTLTPAHSLSPTPPSVPPTSPSLSLIPPSVSPTPFSILYLDQFGVNGDGTDETTKLQTALDYARDHSIHTVIFPGSKVIIVSQKIIFPSGLNVIGNGSTIKLNDNNELSDVFVSIRENVHCTGLTFDGNWQNGSSDNGVRLFSGVVFDGNEVKNVRAYSVYLYDASNVRITNNTIHDSRQYGISTGGSDGPGSWGYNVTVSGNIISNCNQVGIKIRGASGAIITNNTISVPSVTTDSGDNTLSRGISLYSFDEPNEHIVISGNNITGIVGSGDTAGISSDDDNNTDITITGNYVTTCDQGIVIMFNNGVITGNTISHCGQSIINEGSGNIVMNNNVT